MIVASVPGFQAPSYLILLHTLSRIALGTTASVKQIIPLVYAGYFQMSLLVLETRSSSADVFRALVSFHF
jgi:hypothetical protein